MDSGRISKNIWRSKEKSQKTDMNLEYIKLANRVALIRISISSYRGNQIQVNLQLKGFCEYSNYNGK